MLSDNIKAYRQSKNWSQEELSYRIHTTRQTISKWEKGYSVPDANMLIDLAEVFGCSTSDLLGEASITNESISDIANKLENLNILLARRNQRWNKVWRVIGYVFIGLLIATVIMLLLFRAVKFEIS